jgi:hypothetical protein
MRPDDPVPHLRFHAVVLSLRIVPLRQLYWNDADLTDFKEFGYVLTGLQLRSC